MKIIKTSSIVKKIRYTEGKSPLFVVTRKVRGRVTLKNILSGERVRVSEGTFYGGGGAYRIVGVA